DGVATLDGADVTGNAWAFQGAVFADDGEGDPRDFCFTDDGGAAPSGQPARIATAVPFAGAFDPDALWPQVDGDLPGAVLALGTSRWAFFVRSAHFGAHDGGDIAAISIWQAGVFDASVWCGPPTWTAGKVGFDWDEREAFAVKVWLPLRLQALD